MRWVTPRLMIGTERDANTLDYPYLDALDAALGILDDDRAGGVVVPTCEMAEAVLRHLGADDEWIKAHLHTDWAADATDIPTEERLWASFLQTRLRIFYADSITEVVIGTEEPIPSTRTQRENSLHVITAWNPRGAPLDPTENDRRQKEMQDGLDRSTFEWVPAAGVAEDGLWAEASVAITGMTRQEAVQMGRQWDQEAIFEWDPSTSAVTVVSCVDDRLTARAATTYVLPTRPCPMRPPGDRSTQLCQRPGGGWTSDSMQMAAEFDVRRHTMLRALGCDVCQGAAVPGARGRPIVVVPVHDPSRADPSPWTDPHRPPA